MISKELKNDFREMIFGTFAAAFEDLIYSWEKNISFGNGHFQKWVEIIFSRSAPQPPNIDLNICIPNSILLFGTSIL